MLYHYNSEIIILREQYYINLASVRGYQFITQMMMMWEFICINFQSCLPCRIEYRWVCFAGGIWTHQVKKMLNFGSAKISIVIGICQAAVLQWYCPSAVFTWSYSDILCNWSAVVFSWSLHLVAVLHEAAICTCSYEDCFESFDKRVVIMLTDLRFSLFKNIPLWLIYMLQSRNSRLECCSVCPWYSLK